jgi:hypothetical protein
MSGVLRKCYHEWCCCPGWVRMILAFTVLNTVEDFFSFVVVHSVWNLIGFEGFFSHG